VDSRGLGGLRPGLLGFMAREQVRKEQETSHELAQRLIIQQGMTAVNV
jgi:hypothetical protein